MYSRSCERSISKSIWRFTVSLIEVSSLDSIRPRRKCMQNAKCIVNFVNSIRDYTWIFSKVHTAVNVLRHILLNFCPSRFIPGEKLSISAPKTACVNDKLCGRRAVMSTPWWRKKAAKRMRLIKSDVICDRHDEMTDSSYQRGTARKKEGRRKKSQAWEWNLKFQKKSLSSSLSNHFSGAWNISWATGKAKRSRRNDSHSPPWQFD